MVLFGRATYIEWSGQVFDLIDVDSGGFNITTEAIPITKYGTSVIEYAPGYTDYGSLSVTIGADSGASIAALRQMHEANTVAPLSVVMSNGLQISGNAFITSFGDAVDKHGLYTIKLTFKLAGKITTQGQIDTFRVLPPTGTSFFRGGSYTLSLSGNEAYAMAGGNASFSVVDPATHAKITITNNLLTIDSDAPPNNFSVKATISTDGTTTQTIETVEYSVKIPIPSTIAISGPDALLVDKTGAKEQQYNLNAYPAGSNTGATWKFYKYSNNAWVETTAEDNVYITEEGKVMITIQFTSTDATPFLIYAESKANTDLKTTKQITIARKKA